MNNWIPLLLNIASRQDLTKLIGRRRNNTGVMWASLIGLGVSAAAYGIGRSQGRNSSQPVEDIPQNTRSRPRSGGQLWRAVSEFSKELTPNENPLTDK